MDNSQGWTDCFALLVSKEREGVCNKLKGYAIAGVGQGY